MARVFGFVALVALPLADSDNALEYLRPEGQDIEMNPGVKVSTEDSLATAVREAATIILSFALVAVVARLLGVGGSVTLQSNKGKVAKAAKGPKTMAGEARGKSHSASGAAGKELSFRASSASAASDRLAAAANSLAGAVNRGKAAKLPQLIDAAMYRLAAGDVEPEFARAQAAQLLLSSVRACAAKRCFKEAIAAYDHTALLIGDACGTTWSLLLWSAVEASCWDRSIFFAKKLRASGAISQNDVVNVVRCAAYHRDMGQFVKFLDECKAAGVKLEVVTRNRALAVLTSSHFMDFAAEFVARTDDVPLDVITYNTLMKGYALADKPRICIKLYEQMRSDNVTPSDVTFGILLDACVGGSMFEEATRVFDDLKASKQVANVVHYTTYIKGLVSAGRLPVARDVLTEMHCSPHTQPDVITYSTLAKAYAEVGNVDDGLYLLEMMRSHGVEPDVILFNIILSACSAKPVDGRKIVEVFEQVVSFGFKPTSSTYSVLVKACAKSSCWSLALDFIRCAPSRFQVWPETRIYTQLGQACASAGANSEVLLTYSLLIQATRAQGEVVEASTKMRFARFSGLNNASCGLSADALSWPLE